jgi:hypothetical protein
MTRPKFLTRAARFLTIIGAAGRAAAATDAGRRPDAKTLRTLDIDPAQFDKIGH